MKTTILFTVFILFIYGLPAQTLVAYYSFNGNTNDASGNDDNGTVSPLMLCFPHSGLGMLKHIKELMPSTNNQYNIESLQKGSYILKLISTIQIQTIKFSKL